MGNKERVEHDALSRYIRCRDAEEPDPAALAAARRELVGVLFEHVRATVQTQRKVVLNEDEEDEVVSLVCSSLLQGADLGFKGVSMNELQAFIRVIVHRRAVDLVRKHVKERDRVANSFDRGWELQPDERKAIAAELDESVHRWEREERGSAAGEQYTELMALLTDREREVIQDTHDEIDVEVTMERLGISRANLYQVRRRARIKLDAHIEEQDA